MKCVVYNAKMYVERDIFAEAAFIEDGKFKVVGTNEEVLAAAGDCDKYDCGGKTVIPGLNDSHLHLAMVGMQLAAVDIASCRGIDEIVERCKAFIKENPEAVKHGLRGTGWNQDLFTEGEKRYLYRYDLDRISTDIPVVLSRVCGHILAANTKAVEMAGLGPGSPQFEGGMFEFGDDGFPNGFFAEKACGYITAVIPQYTPEEIEPLVIKAMQYAVAHGLTSVQSNDVLEGEVGMKPQKVFDMMHKIYDEGRGLVRYHHQVCFSSPDEFQHTLDTEFKTGKYDGEWLSLGPLKLFKDGSLGARTATVCEEYLDDPGNYGVEAMSGELADVYCRMAADNDIQIITHAIGDDAIEKMLDAYEKVLVDGKNPLRHSIVHYQFTSPQTMDRTVRLGVIAQVQPIFLTTDIHAVPSRFTPEKNRYFLPFKSMIEKGIHISFGTDSPVENCNPFLCLYCAVTRKDIKGYPEGGFFPEEALDVATAIDCYTVESAYAQFMEDKKGRIKAGQLADLVVLDTDIFACDPDKIKDILPVMTMVGGDIKYEKK